jgi:hypothetical protein
MVRAERRHRRPRHERARSKKLGQADEFLRVVSTAKRGGGIDALYFDRDPRRTPWYLVTAIGHALAVHGWLELPDDDQPPQSIWLDTEALIDHFDRIRERHKNPGMESVDDGPLSQNDLTKQFKT